MTIYALSSGPGISGVAVIRISGPETKKIIEKITVDPFPKAREATLKKINKINTNELIDEGILLWFPAPNSYTGEDMKRIMTKKWIVFQAVAGITFLFLAYKYIDTPWIKWPFMIMLAGAFYYSTKEDLNELFKDNLIEKYEKKEEEER